MHFLQLMTRINAHHTHHTHHTHTMISGSVYMYYKVVTQYGVATISRLLKL